MLGRLGAALLALLALLAGCGGVEPEAAPDRDPDALTIILPREAQDAALQCIKTKGKKVPSWAKASVAGWS